MVLAPKILAGRMYKYAENLNASIQEYTQALHQRKLNRRKLKQFQAEFEPALHFVRQ